MEETELELELKYQSEHLKIFQNDNYILFRYHGGKELFYRDQDKETENRIIEYLIEDSDSLHIKFLDEYWKEHFNKLMSDSTISW